MRGVAKAVKSWIGSLASRWYRTERPRQHWFFAGTYDGRLPGSNLDYAGEAARLDLNAVVQSQVGWLADQFVQAKFQVVNVASDGSDDPIPYHALHELLDPPINPSMDDRNESSTDLWTDALWDYVVDGNAYWHVLKNAFGSPVAIEHIPAWRVQPWWPMGGDKFITHYLVDVDGLEQYIPCADIVHFRDRKDPVNERLGVSRLKACLREICGTNEAATFTYRLLKTSGRASIIVSPASHEDQFAPGADELIKEKLKSQGGDGRFDPIVADIPLRIEHASHSPEQLRLNELPASLEATICACIGVSPMVTGLPSARFHNTYANSEDARGGAWDRLAAIQDRMAATVTRQLLPLIEPNFAAKRIRCSFDRSEIDALSEDRAAVVAEAISLFGSPSAPGLITRDEARERLGLVALGGKLGSSLAMIDESEPSSDDKTRDKKIG